MWPFGQETCIDLPSLLQYVNASCPHVVRVISAPHVTSFHTASNNLQCVCVLRSFSERWLVTREGGKTEFTTHVMENDFLSQR